MTKTKNIILDRDAPVLRQTAKEVPLKDIRAGKLAEVIEKMLKALSAEDDGVAIAAPQVGESLRMFIVSSKVKKLTAKNPEAVVDDKHLVFINPRITKFSKKRKRMEEGCLSVRWLYGWVERSEQVTVEAYDETGKKFTTGAGGLMAQIFQHEVDHLDGVLFIDKAEDIEDLPPGKVRKSK